MRTFYRILSVWGSARAASRGPGPYARRVARQQANKQFNRLLRRLLKP